MFPDERACGAYLERVRWPDGFVCPWCGAVGAAYRFENRPTVLRCRACRRNTYLTAGTIMHATRTPLQVWFWGVYLATTQTPGISALQFQRQLGLSRYETAFQMLHKLRASLVRPDRDRLGAEWPVEVDETLVGGKTRGEGRGVHDKTYVAGAVEIRRQRDRHGSRTVYAGRLRLRALGDRGKRSLEAFVTEHLATTLRELAGSYEREAERVSSRESLDKLPRRKRTGYFRGTFLLFAASCGEYDPERFTLKKNPLKRADLDDFLKRYAAGNRNKRQETERYQRFAVADLRKRDKLNLDIFWLKDESLDDVDSLPPPAEIAAEIVENLQAALEQFQSVAEELASPR